MRPRPRKPTLRMTIPAALGLVAEQPDDVAARELRGRASAYLEHPPPPDWSGVYEMTTK